MTKNLNRNVTGFNIPLIKINTVYIVEYYTGLPHLIHLFQVLQTQTTTAYCRILPTLDSEK